MGDFHNVAILVPRDKPLSVTDGSIIKSGTLLGKLPEGSLFIDPWGYVMGNEFDKCFGCTIENFVFKNSLDKISIHYESDKDITFNQIHSTPEANKDPSPSIPIQELLFMDKEIGTEEEQKILEMPQKNFF